MKTLPFLCAFAALLFSCESRPPPGDSSLPGTAQGYQSIGDSAFEGLSPQGAAKLAKKRGLLFRVIEVDGVSRPATKDRRRNRVNFVVAKDRVISTRRG